MIQSRYILYKSGLTADHRLYYWQCQYFEPRYNVFVWDCPCHGKSRPYDTFSYSNVTFELNNILEIEKVDKLVLIGQSLGGMIAQYYIDRYPDKVCGFVAIDTAPFGDYCSKSDLFWLNQLEWMCKLFSDGMLRKSMAKMCGVTESAQNRMLQMLSCYSKKELCHLMYIGEAAFIPENKNISIPCKTILLLGDRDKVGKVASYNRKWAKRTGYPLFIIKDAAHNSNDDSPKEVNSIIQDFISSL